MSGLSLILVPAWLIANASFLTFPASIASGQSEPNRSVEQTQAAVTYAVNGRVFDAVSGQPIAGIRFVYGRPAATTNNGGFTNFAFGKTNNIGEFRLDDLKSGHYALYVASSLNQNDQYSDPVFFDIDDVNLTNLEVPVRHGSRLSGLVVPAGVTNPSALSTLSTVKLLAAVPSIGNLRVGIVNLSAIRPDGSFQLIGLRPGTAIINLKADSESLNGLSIVRIERDGVEQKQGIEIKPGEDISDLQVFIADGTGAIKGQVQIDGGTLPAGTRMLASITNKLRFSNGYAQVDPDGKFVISGLAAGTYEITLNTYQPPPHQGVRMLPTLKRLVKVSDAAESSVLFTIFLGSTHPEARTR
jgi:hypothetical protein